MVRGIQCYYNHPFQAKRKKGRLLWSRGEVELYHYPTRRNRKGALLLIPSLINKSTIFDLLPDISLIRALKAAGYDCYLIDWGYPTQDREQKTLQSLIERRLLPAAAIAAAHHGAPLNALGYCMGGLFLTAAALKETSLFKTLIFLATPWNFKSGKDLFSSQAKTSLSFLIKTKEGEKPSPLSARQIQVFFAALNGDRIARKFATFAAMDQKSPEACRFVAVEDWLNDGPDLPASLVEDCLRRWYLENQPGRRQWHVGTTQIDPSKISVPVLNVLPSRDRVVPEFSARALAEAIPGSTFLKPDCGHIGLITSRSAAKKVVAPMIEWLDKQNLLS
ncbi:MAG: alpha/beta fold hydrolase [Alphaproteobacteria bacterium]|nr:alpha/beta fold hydrolase [Alphaproteobacteria bacterium]